MPPKYLFLIDGIGGVLSAVLLLLLGDYFLMPANILYILAAIAVIYATYSLTCFWLTKSLIIKNWQPYMKIIAVSNLLYCCLTLGLVAEYFSTLTYLGVAYFIGEISVICFLAFIEWKSTNT